MQRNTLEDMNHRRGQTRARFFVLLPLIVLVAVALISWPAYMNSRVDAARVAEVPTPAPVTRDYEQRDQLVAFWEGAVREHHTNDMFSPRQLASQYLTRYREKGDIDDVLRAQQMAQRSLAIMPRNIAAISELANVMLTLHRFHEALADVDRLIPYDPSGAEFLAQKASLQMELGRYGQARATLGKIRSDEQADVAALTVQARYDELTGKLEQARQRLDEATAQVDSNIDQSAASRSWYHVRAGELAFKAGDMLAAIGDEQAALRIFPTDNLGLKDLAKFELAAHHDREALAAASAGARVTPFAETLGYEADAQAALGDARGAAVTRDVIFAIDRIGNAYHVNDRLLAIYYTDHHLRAAEALAIARREVIVRGPEIYAQDTLAWAAAMDGRWDEARIAAAMATRFDTQDPIVEFHAGVIALHFGAMAEAKRRLHRALELNPEFDAMYADAARQTLARLEVPTNG